MPASAPQFGSFDIYALAERLMRMDDATWRRHANPLSGWTRFLFGAAPLFFAIYARVWIGWWALPLVLAVLAWIWINPRAFPEPADYGSWMSRGVLGERIWLARKHHDIPPHHAWVAHATTGFAAAFALCAIWGVIVLNPWATTLGVLGSIVAKAWFIDRMVWLHIDLTGIPFGAPMPQPTLPASSKET
ncbi:MAG: DUF6653 family protein [Pseudomonadota bacterium]